MDRRGFLGRLLGGLSVAAFAPALDLFPSLDLAGKTLPPITIPSYRDAFARMTYEAEGILSETLRRPAYRLVENGLIGIDGLNHQRCINLIPSELLSDANFEQFMSRTVRPAIVKLANSVQSASRFGKLPLPESVDHAYRVDDAKRGISLRAMANYRVTHDDYILRFDVVTD